MLPTHFENITADHILRLVADKITERKTLEYKQALVIGTGDERVEFLADVSSFANASGGDIIFGISEERDEGRKATGIPADIQPLKIDNPATECARIEHLIESGIQPRIPVVQVKAVEISDKGIVLILRVGKSWIAPHMVTHSNRSRFYSRNSSTGKFQLDVQQIGAAFSLQRSLGERLQSWRTERIAKAIAREAPVALQGSQMFLHFVSAEALTSYAVALPRVFDSGKWNAAKSLISQTPHFNRYNADGLLLALDDSSPGNKQSYLQVFKDGRLEYGDSYQLNSQYQEQIPSAILEQAIVGTFVNAMHLLSILDVPEPIFVSLSFVGMKGRQMALPNPHLYLHGKRHYGTFDRDVIFGPDIRAENLNEGYPYPTTLLPIVNSMWQAAGLHQSPYISKDGAWEPPS